MEKISPAVSVIVPVFNAEKYLPVCLESILAQTLTDFEVIVVDDCSTDQSNAVAESFLARFNGRLKIVTLPTNTGSGAVPRNVGLDLSCGKYVYFVDADDFLIDNALEELFNAAETFGADVVYTEGFFHCGTEIVPSTIRAESWDPSLIVEEPTFETDDVSARIKKFVSSQIKWPTWTKFVRRDLLIDNAIKFPPLRICEDGIWLFKVLCLAKKWLRIPTPVYVYRENKLSVTKQNRTPQEEIIFWTNPLINGVDCLNEFMDGLEFFNRAGNIRLRVLNFFANVTFTFMEEPFNALEHHEVYKIFTEEVSKSTDDHTALIAYMFVMTNLYQKVFKT